jgi:hypothetical protein
MSLTQTDLDDAIRAVEMKMGASAGFDPLASLGIDREEKQYAKRLLALTDPTEYAKQRAAAFTNMKSLVRSSYTGSYNSFLDAGYSSDQAKGSALAAAEQTRQVQRLIIEQAFPSAANAIGDASQVRSAAAFSGMSPTAGMAARRSAPRKSTTRTAAQRAASARKGAATRRRKAKK